MSRLDFLYPLGITFALFMVQQSFQSALLYGDAFYATAGKADVWIQFLAWPVWLMGLVTIGFAIRDWVGGRKASTVHSKEVSA